MHIIMLLSNQIILDLILVSLKESDLTFLGKHDQTVNISVGSDAPSRGLCCPFMLLYFSFFYLLLLTVSLRARCSLLTLYGNYWAASR